MRLGPAQALKVNWLNRVSRLRVTITLHNAGMSDSESERPLPAPKTTGVEQQPFWKAYDVPGENSDVFQSYMKRGHEETGVKPEIFQPRDDEISNWLEAPNSKCYASFGDDGVTATVNAYGDLMQFSCSLGVGCSGVFSADHRYMDEPYWVDDRARQLHDIRQDLRREFTSYGLRIPSIDLEKSRLLGYVHDRWPRYRAEDKTSRLNLTTQWMVYEKTVLQQCIITNIGTDDTNVPVEFAKRMHLRDLNYLENTFIVLGFQNQILGPNHYGWVLVHPLEEPDQHDADSVTTYSTSPLVDQAQTDPANLVETPENLQSPSAEISNAIAVVVSVFKDGQAVKWRPDSLDDVDNTDILDLALEGKTATEIVIAYKMIHLTKTCKTWENLLIPPAWADVSKHLESASFTAFHPSDYGKPVEKTQDEKSKGIFSRWMRFTSSSNDTQPYALPIDDPVSPHGLPTKSPVNRIDFVTRRNLEHILSTCALPIGKCSVEGEQGAVALTCGDISGHRVSSSASFFAFLFLLEIVKHLKAIEKFHPDHPYKPLRRRIDSVCRGHLKWLLKVDLTEESIFAANYWVTGRIMPSDTGFGSFMPSNSFTDTPFQLMKVAAFSSLYNTKVDRELARQVIQRVDKYWIDTLQKSDKRTSHVWPRAQDEGCNKYRLNEHVWIWRALTAIEENRRRSLDAKNPPSDGVEAHGEASKNVKEDQEGNDKGRRDQAASDEEKLFRQFGSDIVHRDILRRFTVENDVSKKRMLATTRSSRETRFLFHASDTALFYGIEWDFFLPALIDEVWDNTIEAQLHHNENSETGWDNSIRYALAIMMGTRNMRLNKRSSKDLVKSAFDVLFRTTSPNGLFYGQLDATTKEPVLFVGEADRDFYFHASFEIPYILLTHCWRINSILEDSSENNLESPPPFIATQRSRQHPFNEVAEIITQQPKRQEHRSPATQVPAAETAEAQSLSPDVYLGVKPKKPKATAMKKSIPFNSLIDQSSIVDLEDEWLYNYPNFLGGSEQTLVDFHKEAEALSKPTGSSHSGTVITKAAKDYIEDLPVDFDPGVSRSYFKSLGLGTWVVNVRKRKNLSKQERAKSNEKERFLTNIRLWVNLSQTRTAKTAKKRFIWLPHADAETALICYISSPQDERPAISDFFDSHFHYENKFLEETTMVLNTWKSELHLSFYLLEQKSERPLPGIPSLSYEELPGNSDWRLARASVGFRFSGDFFDRYWTCHLIEYTHSRSGLTWTGHRPWGRQGWQQRKVLELYLFDGILKEIIKSSAEIFDTVKQELGDKRGVISFSALNSVDYLSSSTKWQFYQQILQVVEQELSDVLSTVAKWETREKDRGHERPRWTRNDERKYRGSIGKMQGSTARRIRDLQKHRNDVRSLKEQLKSEQQQSRDNISVIDAENVRLFTYVTVVFLPLGFAASIFSMSEEPPSSVLKPMIVCSAVALALTFVALGNAKKVSTAISKYSHDKIYSNKLSSGREVRGDDGRVFPTRQQEDAEIGSTSEEDDTTPESETIHQENHNTSFSRHFWFWIEYVFINLPARRVSVAYLDLIAENPSHCRYFHVPVGIIVLPMLLFARLIQFLLLTVMDLGQLAWGKSLRTEPKPLLFERLISILTGPIEGCISLFFTSDRRDEYSNLGDRMNWLTNPTYIYRPLENRVKNVNERLADQRIEKERPPIEEEFSDEET
ncbi:uncharacterized protein CCOS01_02116 [Colletotrichum costaricense]|uniref:Mg2+ transporter n=1 Tax=Colletotrichum costaricense TaxID=1209916 RepID=A0AAI9Z7C4_9PEZI|nr:uncharacterized protein CCOS01_02116 [Colletotrichum costaricense]KAK1536796.1 hypothetical protein CCOS01_02116 [Colletotrichum costaricense]